MTLSTHGSFFIYKQCRSSFAEITSTLARTASEVKIRHAQQDVVPVTPLNDTGRFNFGIGIDMNSGTAEEAADRALTSVARKLDKSLSVESTVNELIAEATDIQNLAVIFHGWGPFF